MKPFAITQFLAAIDFDTWRVPVCRLFQYAAISILAITSSCAVASQRSEPSLLENTRSLCDRAVEEARIFWEEGRHLSADEFEGTLHVSRADAAVAGRAIKEIDRLLKHHGPNSDVAAQMLATAASSDLPAIVVRLLEEGVPVDGKGGIAPPLVTASFCGRHELVSDLLAWGADPNVYWGEPGSAEPMVQAIANRDRELAELLLAHGYDPCRTELTDGRDLKDLLDRHPQLDADDEFWSQLVCNERARGRARP
jgi:hypothetical protein